MNPSENPPPANQPSSSTLGVTATPTASEFTTSVAGDGNFLAAIAAGLVAAVVGAAIWAAITVATGYQIGFMAIGVGFLVGFAVRGAGKGSSNRFAIAGAVLALAGCVLGNLLTVIGAIAQHENAGFFSLLGKLTPSTALEFLQLSFQPMDLLFYAIAVYEGFKVSRVSA